MRTRFGRPIYLGVILGPVLLGMSGNLEPVAGRTIVRNTEAQGMKHVTGQFDVKVVPQAADAAGGEGIGRMLLDKQFHGTLEASSKGQMLASGTGGANTSGAYVALEAVSGTLDGKKGTFVLMHSATMTKGVPALSVTVVPDSGTGELHGLAGKMEIVIEGGKHSYIFDYTLP